MGFSALTLAFLLTGGLGDFLPALVIDVVNEAIPGSIEARRTRFEAPATVILEEARLLGPGGRLVCQVGLLKFTVSVSDILDGNLVITDLTILRAQLSLTMQEGRLNLERAFVVPGGKNQARGKRASGTQITIERVRVADAQISYEDPGKISIHAHDIDGTGRVEVFTNTGLVYVTMTATSIGKGKVELPDLAIPFRQVKFDSFRLRGQRLAIDGLRLGAAGARIKGKVRIKLGDGGNLDLKLDVDAKSGSWPEGLKPPPFALPNILSAVHVTGAFQNPLIRARGSFAPFSAYDFALGRGLFNVDITAEAVTILSAETEMAKGKIAVQGSYRLKSQRLALKAVLAEVPIRLLAGPAKLGEPPRGHADGTAEVEGVVDGEAPLHVVTDLQLHQLEAFGLTPPRPTRARVRLAIFPKRIKVSSARLTGKGLEAAIKGDVMLAEKRIMLNVEAEVAAPTDLVPQIPDAVQLTATHFSGRVVGPFSRIRVEGVGKVATTSAYGVPGHDLQAQLAIDQDQVLLTEIAGQLAAGRVHGWIKLGLREGADLEGDLGVDKASIAEMKFEGSEDLALKGTLDLKARLGGRVADPLVHLHLVGRDLSVKKEQIGEIRLDAWVTTGDVRVASLSVAGLVMNAVTEGELAVDLVRKEIAGRIALERFSLASLHVTAGQKLRGEVKGPITFAGPLAAPTVLGHLRLHDISVQDILLGSGPAEVQVLFDGSSNPNVPEHLLLVSARLFGPRGRVQARVGLALERRVINADIDLHGTDLEPWLVLAGVDERGEALLPFEGRASVHTTITGALADPTLHAVVTIPELAIRRRAIGTGPVAALHKQSNRLRSWDTRGPIKLSATFVAGKLAAVICAFPDFERGPNADTVCDDGEQIWVDVKGPVDLQTGAFNLEALFAVREPRLESFVTALAEAEVTAQVEAKGHLRLTREGKDTEPAVSGRITLTRLELHAVEAEPIVLMEPREIEIAESGDIVFNLAAFDLAPAAGKKVRSRAPLLFRTGESKLQISGGLNVKTKILSLVVDGQVALSLIKPLSTALQAAGGEIEAHVQLAGSFEHPEIVGTLTPLAGAFITPRALGRRVELVSGTITTRVLDSKEPLPDARFLEISINPDGDTLEAKLDDGVAALEGSILVNLSSGQVTTWNLRAFGSGLFFRLTGGYVETAFDLEMMMAENLNETTLDKDGLHPLLRGRVEINDGRLKKTLELRNFVVTQSTSSRREKPLRAILKEAGLHDLELDLIVLLHNFEVLANLATFRADGALRGQIAIEKFAVAPILSGAVEVVDGTIQFPYARFEIQQTQVDFPPSSDGRVNPHIFLSARGELEPPRNGLEIEVPCQLTLDGNLDGLALKLAAEASDLTFTEGALMRFVLLGTPLSANAVVTDGDAALRALSSELTAAFSRDLEEAIADQLGARLRFDVFYEDGQLKGGVRYQLGERLEFDGEAAFASVGGSTGENGGSVTEARIRLLLIDHLPYFLGRELAFEGYVTTGDGINTQASTDLRLSYRFFEL